MRTYAKFQSTHPRGVRLARTHSKHGRARISIHAPHAGCDSDPTMIVWDPVQFQSTHPTRGATRTLPRLRRQSSDFNPRTPCGVRREPGVYGWSEYTISIHAPHAGCDMAKNKAANKPAQFQSTHPRGVRLAYCVTKEKEINFNPRPREGCDERTTRSRLSPPDFNPRTREGCDMPMTLRASRCCTFQSTHPRGVRHKVTREPFLALMISIHAPARGATSR